MLVQAIDYFLCVWFITAALSTAYVAWAFPTTRQTTMQRLKAVAA
jgi:hypothetical protein